MNDGFNPLGWFLPNKDPNVDLATRQKLALAMMARGRKSYPKNLGEGIASIGENVADAMRYNAMLEQNAEENKGNAAFVGQFTGAQPQQQQTETTPPSSAPLAAAAASAAPPNPSIVPPQPAQTPIVRPAPIPRQDGTLGNRGDTVFPTHANGLVEPQSPPPPALPPSPAQAATPPAGVPPVVAQDGEDPRRAVGQALLRQQMGGAPTPAPAGPPRPSVADFGQPSALAPTPPQAIPAAPPANPVRAAPPPQQTAQAQQEFPPGYVMPERPKTQPPPLMTPLQQQIEAKLQAEPPATQATRRAAVAPILAQEQRKVDQAHEEWKSQQTQDRAMELEREKQKAASATAKMDYQTKQQDLVTPQAAPTSGYDPRLGTKDSPQRDGIPKPPPVPPGQSEKVWADKHAPELVKIRPAVDRAVPQLQESLNLIQLARTHPGRALGVGATGSFARERAGTEAHAFGGIVKQIQGKTFMTGYETLKGAGAIGEKEGLKGQEAQSSVDPDQHKEAFDASLDRLEKTLRASVEAAQRASNLPVTAWQRTPDDPVAPDKGERQQSRQGTFEYLGGDPENKTNWKRVYVNDPSAGSGSSAVRGR